MSLTPERVADAFGATVGLLAKDADGRTWIVEGLRVDIYEAVAEAANAAGMDYRGLSDALKRAGGSFLDGLVAEGNARGFATSLSDLVGRARRLVTSATTVDRPRDPEDGFDGEGRTSDPWPDEQGGTAGLDGSMPRKIDGTLPFPVANKEATVDLSHLIGSKDERITFLPSLPPTKEARRDFSYSEKSALIEEAPDKRARNQGKLDLKGTHYTSSTPEELDDLTNPLFW